MFLLWISEPGSRAELGSVSAVCNRQYNPRSNNLVAGGLRLVHMWAGWGYSPPGRTLLLGLSLLSDFFPEIVLAHESVEIEDAVQMVCFVFQRLGE